MGCFVPIESSSLGILRVERDNDILEQLNCALAVTHQPLEFAKSAVKSRHHRSAYPDIIMVRRFDSHGRLIGERRFIGLYTSRVYNTSCQKIPYVRRKFSEVMHEVGFLQAVMTQKALIQILESYPREELFQTPVDELYSAVVSIVLNQDHPELQLFMRRDPLVGFSPH